MLKKPTPKMQEMFKCASDCALHLVKTSGITEDEAIKKVCDLMNSSVSKDPDLIMATMKMLFMDQDVDEASKDIIKNFLK